MTRDFRYVLELTWCISKFGFPMVFRDGPNNGVERLYEPRYNLVETPYYPPTPRLASPGCPLLGDGGLDELKSHPRDHLLQPRDCESDLLV